MKKSRFYLHETDVLRLRRLAEAEGRSQADIVRSALAKYEASATARHFALAGSWAGDGTSIAGIPEAERLDGFGR